jgi:hypothetical protein
MRENDGINKQFVGRSAAQLYLVTTLSSNKKALTVDIVHSLWWQRRRRLCVLKASTFSATKVSRGLQKNSLGTSAEIKHKGCTTVASRCVGEPTADTPVLSDKEAKSRSGRSSGKVRQSPHARLLCVGHTGAVNRLLQGGQRQREPLRGGQQQCGQDV